MKYLLILILLTFLVPLSKADEIYYSIYELPIIFGDKKLIEDGKLEYSIKDIATKSGPIANVPNKVESIWLNDSFAISYTSFPEKKVPDGFGLTLSKDYGGFSWEWFIRADGDIFNKLQGPGKVRALFIKNKNGLLELGSVKVLENITLRVNTLQWLPFWDGDTYHVEIKKGSTIVFAKSPNNSFNRVATKHRTH